MKTKLFFDYTAVPHAKNEDILVHVLLDTNNQSINAVEGNIVVDDVFTIKDIKDGDSNINLWLNRPTDDMNTVSFSGIVTGGINSPKTKIFSMVLNAKQEGSGFVQAGDIKVLQNDGKGSALETSIESAQIEISKAVGETKIAEVDTEKPESFTPIIDRNDAMFDGNHFIVFSTQDKKSGIKEYKIKEGIFGSYTTVQSPYELKDQTLTSFISVKAIDKMGNERVMTMSPQQFSPVYVAGIGIITLTIVVLLGVFIWKRTFSRS